VHVIEVGDISHCLESRTAKVCLNVVVLAGYIGKCKKYLEASVDVSIEASRMSVLWSDS
jgi:hypothetical protein